MLTSRIFQLSAVGLEQDLQVEQLVNTVESCYL